MTFTQEKSPSVIRKLYRFFVPKTEKSSATLDLVLHTQQVVEHQKRAVSALIPAIPALAIIYVTVNVLVQVQGDKNLALAIVTNLPLGSLAMVVLLHAAGMILLGMAIAGPAVALDPTQTTFVRKFFWILTFVSAFIYALTISALFALLGLLLAYLTWRKSMAGAAKTFTFREWVQDDTPPQDEALCEIWIKARTLDKKNTDTGPEVYDSPAMTKLDRERRDRRRAIQGAATPDFRNALYRSGAVLISTYGLMMLTTAVQLGPLEIAQFKSGPSITGYVLIANEDRGIVFDPKTRVVKSVVASDITGRLLCTRTPSWSNVTLGDLNRLNSLSWQSRESCA